MNVVDSMLAGGCTDRVRAARERIRGTAPSICLEKAQIMTEVFMKTEGEPRPLREGKSLKELCRRGTILIQDGELIVGQAGSRIRAGILMPEQSNMLADELDAISTREHDRFLITEEQKHLFRGFIQPYWRDKSRTRASEGLSEVRQLEAAMAIGTVGASLPIQNYELIIAVGIEGMRDRVNARLAKLNSTAVGTADKVVYLQALLLICDAIEELAARYSGLAKEMAAAETSLNKKAELETIAGVCNRVPAQPARTFREALQSLWFYHVMSRMDSSSPYSPGRMDQYLYPYYARDIEHGIITKEEAQELLECLWVKFSELCLLSDRHFASFVPGYPTFEQVTCGGVTPGGEDAVNELSYMMIQATMDVRLPWPNLTVKYNEKNPDSFLRKAAELEGLGIGHPQFYNDEVGTKYTMEIGIPFEEACHWSPSGCKDLALMGKMGGLRVPVSVNMASAVEFALLDGVCRSSGRRLPVPLTGDPRTFASYEYFEDAVKTHLRHLIKIAADLALTIEKQVRQGRSELVTSLSFEECVENGCGFMAGGAKYTPGPEIVMVGNADVFDSLAAIKALVYEKQSLSWDELLQALSDDFGDIKIRELCLSAPKYGNDDDSVDGIASEMTEFCAREVNKHVGLDGGVRVPVTTAAAWHIHHGLGTGALPSGRKAGTPLSDGISPMQGTDRKGPTAVLKSVSKCPLDAYRSPLLNMKLDPSLFRTEKGIQDFMALMKAWHELGLYHVQFNVVSAETLRQAQQHPDQYRDLMVRVSGYCAFFVDLYESIQNDIIARTTFRDIPVGGS